jgi:hypothetical protein
VIRGLGIGSQVALVAAIACACAAPARAAEPAHEVHIGMMTNAQGHGPELARELDRVPPGTTWLREDLEWRVVEPRPGRLDWSRYDLLFQEAADRGIRILPGIGSDPLWLGFAGSWNPCDHLPADPDERLAFAEFAARVAARYGPGGEFWLEHPDIADFAPREFEIWNEPYIAKAAGGEPDGGAYAELVRASAGAMKAVNPEVRVGLAADWAPAGDPYGRSTFIDDMFARVPDLGSYYDFVSVHPYTDGSPPSDDDGGFGFPRIGWVNALLLAHGAPEKPLWITEIGWSTCDPESEDGSCVSEEAQAQYLREAIDLAQSAAYPYVDALFVYRRIDLDYPDDPKESYFGIEHIDGSPKPAYDVYEQAVGG